MRKSYWITALILIVISAAALAKEPEKKQIIVYEADRFGNTRYDKPSKVLKNGRIYTVDQFGNTRYDLPSYKIKEESRR